MNRSEHFKVYSPYHPQAHLYLSLYTNTHKTPRYGYDVVSCAVCVYICPALYKRSSPARRKQLPELLPICGATLTNYFTLLLFFMLLHIKNSELLVNGH